MEALSVVFGLIVFLLFVGIAWTLGGISKKLSRIVGIMEGWAEETGFGYEYKCKECKKRYIGKKDSCPHCGDPKNYPKSK